MKGLVRAAPTVERIQVASRAARKHYGFESFVSYDPSEGHLASKWYAYMLLGFFFFFALTFKIVNGIHTQVAQEQVL